MLRLRRRLPPVVSISADDTDADADADADSDIASDAAPPSSSAHRRCPSSPSSPSSLKPRAHKRGSSTTSSRSRSRHPPPREAALLRTASLCIYACCTANTLALLYLFLVRSGHVPRAARGRMSKETRAADADAAFDAAAVSYGLVFSTGRCATRHLASLLVSADGRPRAVVTHQDAGEGVPAREAVARLYRPLAAASAVASGEDEARFNASADAFVRDVALPGLRSLLDASGATRGEDSNLGEADRELPRRVVYTGHVPLAFGLGPALVRAVPPGALRILRLRRDRIDAAASLMALGPEEEDPWADEGGQVEEKDDRDESRRATDNQKRSRSRSGRGKGVDRRRWFPGPTAPFVRLQVGEREWAGLNRFQKWLWFVDDVECRWQALREDPVLSARFEWREETLEALAVLDGGRGWREVARFLGVDVRDRVVGVRENSIQDKGRTKVDVEEAVLRRWDEEYRRIVRVCYLAPDGSRTVEWGSGGGE